MLSVLKKYFRDEYYSKLDALGEIEPKRVPVLDTGIPLHSPDKLILGQEEAVSKIKLITEYDKTLFDKYYGSLIYNYARYVHQLPASENHHHAAVGGLFRHGLEVAATAYQIADDRIFDPNASLEKRRVVEPVYRYSVFIAALLHDIGKAAYDVVVHDRTHNLVWDPFIEPLYDWAKRNKLTHYYIHYSKNRVHKKHELLTTIVISQVIPKHCLSFIHNADSQILPTMLGALSGIDSPDDNEVLKIIEMADHNSVRLSLQGALDLEGHSFSGVTLPQHFMNTARLLETTSFKPNKPGSKVYYANGEAFMIFPAAVQLVIDQLEKDGVNGIPRDPEVMLTKLVNSNVVVTRKDPFGGETPIWNLRFTKRDNATRIKFKCIRLVNSQAIFSSPPPKSANIELLNDQGEVIELFANEQSSDDDSPVIEQSQKKSLTPLMKPAEAIPNSVGFESVLSALGKSSASAIFLSSLFDDLKSPSQEISSFSAVQEGQLCLLFPESFDHYGIDAFTTTKELLSKKLIDSNTGDPEKAATEQTINDKIYKVIKFTKTFSEIVCTRQSLQSLSVSVLKSQQPFAQNNNVANDTTSPNEVDTENLLQDFISSIISLNTMEAGFSRRKFNDKLYVSSKDAVRWYEQNRPGVNHSDLELALKAASLEEEIPKELKTEFSAQTTLILKVVGKRGGS